MTKQFPMDRHTYNGDGYVRITGYADKQMFHVGSLGRITTDFNDANLPIFDHGIVREAHGQIPGQEGEKIIRGTGSLRMVDSEQFAILSKKLNGEYAVREYNCTMPYFEPTNRWDNPGILTILSEENFTDFSEAKHKLKQINQRLFDISEVSRRACEQEEKRSIDPLQTIAKIFPGLFKTAADNAPQPPKQPACTFAHEYTDLIWPKEALPYPTL